jgi:voltage-gated potassium channel
MINLHKYIGLAGVSDDENTSARIVGKIFERSTVVIILLLALQWQMDIKGGLSKEMNFVGNWIIWIFFVIQAIIVTTLVDSKVKYLRRNWGLPLIIIGGIVLLLNLAPIATFLIDLRPFLVMWLLIPWLDIFRQSLSDNRLLSTLLTAVFVMFLAGIFIAGLDPAIPTPWDGIWWAWVTMSTVGYGDVVPVSGIGRLFGAGLILMGLAMFAVITANFSAIFVQREVRAGVKEVKKEVEATRVIIENIQAVKRDEESIVRMLYEIQKRLDRLEQQFSRT